MIQHKREKHKTKERPKQQKKMLQTWFIEPVLGRC
jgi:hypothetical protein